MICIFYSSNKLYKIDTLYRLKKRLPEKHPMYEKVCLDLYNYTNQFGSVEQVDQELRRVGLGEPYAILPNLHNPDPHITCPQINVLVATTTLLKDYEYLPQVLTEDSFQQIILTHRLENSPFTLNPLCNDYSILPNDLKNGLFCSICHFQLLKRSNRIYYCPNCMNIPDNPFADAMTDWFFLVGTSITNRELQGFTNTSNSSIISYFMKSSGFVKTGNTRDRVYHYC